MTTKTTQTDKTATPTSLIARDGTHWELIDCIELGTPSQRATSREFPTLDIHTQRHPKRADGAPYIVLASTCEGISASAWLSVYCAHELIEAMKKLSHVDVFTTDGVNLINMRGGLLLHRTYIQPEEPVIQFGVSGSSNCSTYMCMLSVSYPNCGELITALNTAITRCNQVTAALEAIKAAK